MWILQWYLVFLIYPICTGWFVLYSTNKSLVHILHCKKISRHEHFTISRSMSTKFWCIFANKQKEKQKFWPTEKLKCREIGHFPVTAKCNFYEKNNVKLECPKKFLAIKSIFLSAIHHLNDLLFRSTKKRNDATDQNNPTKNKTECL